MIQFPHVLQECPVCGRPARVPLQYLKHRVTCQHCGGTFLARDSVDSPQPYPHREHPMLRRAATLLEIAARRSHSRRLPGLDR